MRPWACAEWCESAHFTYAWRQYFTWHSPYKLYQSEIQIDVLQPTIQYLTPPLAKVNKISKGECLWRKKQIFVSFWRKNVHKYWLTAKRTKPVQKKYVQVNWLARHDLYCVYFAVKCQPTNQLKCKYLQIFCPGFMYLIMTASKDKNTGQNVHGCWGMDSEGFRVGSFHGKFFYKFDKFGILYLQ